MKSATQQLIDDVADDLAVPLPVFLRGAASHSGSVENATPLLLAVGERFPGQTDTSVS